MYHVDWVKSGVPIRLWFGGNVDRRRIGKQTHWNKSLPKSTRMGLTKSMPIGRQWKQIGLVPNDSSQKGSSWIWSKVDFWNLRFGLSCLSAVQRLVDCTRFCKIVLTHFTPAVHRAFLFMHFMITTWTRSRQIWSLGRSRTVSHVLIGAQSNIFWIRSSRSQSYIRGRRTRSNLPMTAIVSCRIHIGFSTSTCSFLAFV